MYEFQPPDIEEESDDEKWERWFSEKEKNGYAVISRDEWRARLDEAATDGYAEGRKDEREATLAEFSALLPGPHYMDPPDGGSVSVLEQFKRMVQDAARYRWMRANVNDQIPYRGWWEISGPDRPERLDAAIDAELAS